MDILYVTDLDGTLLDPTARLSQETLRLLVPLIAAGLPLTVATARSWRSAQGMVGALGIRLPVVLMNGGFIYDPQSGACLKGQWFDMDVARAVEETMNTHGIHPLIYTLDEGDESHIYYPDASLQSDGERAYIARRVAENDSRMRRQGADGDWKTERPFYVNTAGPRDTLAPLAEELGAHPALSVVFYEDIYTHGHWWLEVNDRRGTKGAGVAWLRDRLGPRQLVCIGDQRNDLSMLTLADLAVTVENGCEEARALAHVVLGPSWQDSVARWIAGRESV